MKKVNRIVKGNYHNDFEDYLELSDGTTIHFHHEQDCCENVYADLSALEDTGFETDGNLTLNNLHISLVKGYGVKINSYGIPCYNEQNGYYDSSITVIVKHNFDVDTYGHSDID